MLYGAEGILFNEAKVYIEGHFLNLIAFYGAVEDLRLLYNLSSFESCPHYKILFYQLDVLGRHFFVSRCKRLSEINVPLFVDSVLTKMPHALSRRYFLLFFLFGFLRVGKALPLFVGVN